MRVLEIINSAQVGGGGNHVVALVEYLRAQSVTVEVAVSDDGPLVERLRALDVRIHPIAFMDSRFNLWVSGRILSVIRDFRPDLIHLHGTRVGFFGTIARTISNGIPMMYTVHGFSFRKDGSRWEGLPYALLEALAMEKPVVATATSGACEIMTDGMHGLLVPPGDDAAIAQAVEWIMDHPNESQAMAQRGRKRVLDEFTQQKMLRDTQTLYAKVLQRHGLQANVLS